MAGMGIALALLLASAAQAEARLDLARLYENDARAARVAAGVEALHGERVRVAGYMVRMEGAPPGAFYLARYPMEAAEGGAGTADLPPGALRVEGSSRAGEEVAWVPGVVEVTGTLEVGRAEDADGRVSWLRVVAAAWTALEPLR